LDAPAPEKTGFKTNRDFHVHKHMAMLEQTGHPKLTGQFGQFAAVMTHRMTEERLKKALDYPIHFLVLVGTRDEVLFSWSLMHQLIRPENSFELCKVLKCRLELLHDVGHAPMFEKKDYVNQVMEAHFLEASKASKVLQSQLSEETLAEEFNY
jgi:pimeloyl-ACP methyl ester carboxylesterase